ncbi:hypothetical protein OG21DRAFT_1515221 [Imleria badia]|nr:hypothetical protein OG21DRAFT_1515221 [Imleria badia]
MKLKLDMDKVARNMDRWVVQDPAAEMQKETTSAAKRSERKCFSAFSCTVLLQLEQPGTSGFNQYGRSPFMLLQGGEYMHDTRAR